MDTYNFAKADYLLTRDWFIEEEGILEVLFAADSDAWVRICESSHKYSRRIRDMIEDFRPPPTKLTIRSINDTEYTKSLVQQRRRIDGLMEEQWLEFSKTLPKRPRRVIDDIMDERLEALSSAKTQHLRRGKKKVTPEMILKLENEYRTSKALVDQADSDYLTDIKDDFRIKYLYKM